MRIISGSYKGRAIRFPVGIRPTQNKVRKALFDILGDIKGLSFLELFAGSGAVGLEAASQGVKEVVLVEEDKECIKRIKENIFNIGFLPYRVIASDVFSALRRLNKRKEKFDIVFLDPPYYKGLGKKTLKMLSTYDIVTQHGFVIIQHFKKDSLPECLGDFILFKQAGYADTALTFYRKP